jgi:hypothetical protein
MSICSSLELTILPDKIHFLKFILEGYDGLAIQSTIDPLEGVVKISYPNELHEDLTGVLASLHSVISPVS